MLPVVFCLLAVCGSLVPAAMYVCFGVDFDSSVRYNYGYGFLVALLVVICIVVIRRIKRHTPSMEECFQVALMLGIASYWLPTVLFLILPVWGYLVYQNQFSLRSLVATLVGFAVVAVWAAVFVRMDWIADPWAEFFASKNAWGWIPTGAVILAWLVSTIVRQTLRVR